MEPSEIKNEQTVRRNASANQVDLIEIEREYNVPVQRLFDAFKSPEAIKAWWWPNGLYTDQVNLDFREGGDYFINMKGSRQSAGGMTGQFEEIVDNKRIVMSDSFADENGHAISAKEANMPGEWPDEIHVTFDFDSVSESKSRVKLSQDGIPPDVQKDCKQGWSEMFDKLEKYLSS